MGRALTRQLAVLLTVAALEVGCGGGADGVDAGGETDAIGDRAEGGDSSSSECVKSADCPEGQWCDAEYGDCSGYGGHVRVLKPGKCRVNAGRLGETCVAQGDCGSPGLWCVDGKCDVIVCQGTGAACQPGCAWAPIPHSCAKCLCTAECPSGDGGAG